MKPSDNGIDITLNYFELYFGQLSKLGTVSESAGPDVFKIPPTCTKFWLEIFDLRLKTHDTILLFS